tara:strand:+ start:544 stop:900 length:357 start_codon:yes stop_codon:yes gene_type:complete
MTKQKKPEVGDKLIMHSFHSLRTTKIKKFYKNGNFITEDSNLQYKPDYNRAGEYVYQSSECEPFTQGRYDELNMPFVRAKLINKMYGLLKDGIYTNNTYKYIIQLLEDEDSKALHSQK